MELWQIVLLFICGFLGSVINAIAGGGTFIAFPALLFLGLPPTIANATSTVAFAAGALTTAFNYRKGLTDLPFLLLPLLIMAVLGGGLGAITLYTIGDNNFSFCIPWLLLFATIIMWASPYLKTFLEKRHNDDLHSRPVFRIVLKIFQFLTMIYGGFFGAGIGILLLASLSFYHFKTHYGMNAVKSTLGFATNITAVLFFIIMDMVDWHAMFPQMAGCICGGYFGSSLGKVISRQALRSVMLITGFTLTILYFLKNYSIL